MNPKKCERREKAIPRCFNKRKKLHEKELLPAYDDRQSTFDLKTSQSPTFKKLLTNYESRIAKVRSSHLQVLDTI